MAHAVVRILSHAGERGRPLVARSLLLMARCRRRSAARLVSWVTDGWDGGQVADDALRTGGCAESVGILLHDEVMHEEKMHHRDGFWLAVRTHPVPWVLFLATALAAVILACR